ncbi:MAG: MBOAT family protein [Myxococcales bacterium]|nr:MBOAT family protein [Myxococcales bacterium]
MNFDSIQYLLFLALVVAAFVVLPGRGRAAMLLLASLGFYAVWSVPMTGLILISGAVDFCVGLLLERSQDQRRRRLLLALSMSVNLGILGYFKYKGFFLENLQALGLVEPGSWAAVLLPPGISFYTFQTMSYSIDVYRRELSATRSPLQFLLYVCFFPQLIAGPIERAGNLLPQFEAMPGRKLSAEDLGVGLRMVIFGLFKKVVLADYFAILVDRVFANPDGADGWTALCALYFFALQIYFDFSAYSEIAKGSARMLGVNLVWNFDQPYLAGNISDFWRRWHISLSNWFRDYVYKPLGGSRAGKGRVLFNLGATMFLSGLWHGAAWNFVLWGLFHGLLLLLHHQLRDRRPLVALRTWAPELSRFLAWFVTLHAVILGWLLFRVEALADVVPLLRSIGLALAGEQGLPTRPLTGIVLFFVILSTSLFARRVRLLERLETAPTLAVAAYAVLATVAILLARDEVTQFIYFQF